MSDDAHHIAIFRQKEIRKQLYHGEWWFVVVDVVEVLTGSADAGAYWRKLKQRLAKEGDDQTVTDYRGLKFVAKDGKKRKFDCLNTEDLFRLEQSIPSKKAEPFKRWLARVGYERVQEIENPELAQKRMKMLYRLKGYDDAWIDRHVQGMEVLAHSDE